MSAVKPILCRILDGIREDVQSVVHRIHRGAEIPTTTLLTIAEAQLKIIDALNILVKKLQ
jgi:hypothetical protein